MSDSQRWKSTVYVGGLSPLATNSHVLDAFIPFGEIVEVQVPKNDKPGSTEPHKGFAYVEYEDSADAKEAIDNMDQAEFFGKVLKVSQAKAPKSADEGLGSKTAIWEQVSSTMFIHSYHTVLMPRKRRAGFLSKPGKGRMKISTMATGRHPTSQSQTRCKDWRAWMWLGRSRNDEPGSWAIWIDTFLTFGKA